MADRQKSSQDRCHDQQAAAFLVVSESYDGFASYLARRLPRPAPTIPANAASDHLPSATPESDTLSADLKSRGFRFVGSTTVYAFMQSAGLVDDHLPGCFRYRG